MNCLSPTKPSRLLNAVFIYDEQNSPHAHVKYLRNAPRYHIVASYHGNREWKA